MWVLLLYFHHLLPTCCLIQIVELVYLILELHIFFHSCWTQWILHYISSILWFISSNNGLEEGRPHKRFHWKMVDLQGKVFSLQHQEVNMVDLLAHSCNQLSNLYFLLLEHIFLSWDLFHNLHHMKHICLRRCQNKGVLLSSSCKRIHWKKDCLLGSLWYSLQRGLCWRTYLSDHPFPNSLKSTVLIECWFGILFTLPDNAYCTLTSGFFQYGLWYLAISEVGI